MNKKILAVAAAGVLIAGTVFFFYSRQNSSNSRLKLSGTIEVTSVELSFKVPGKMQQRLVDEGETVKAGQIVARLEDTELKDERSARLAEQRAAQAGLADIKAGNRREEIAQGEAILARMRAEADKCAKDAVRMEALFRREVIPQKDLDTARAARDASAAAVREAEDRLRLLKIGARPDAIKERQSRAEAAGAMLALAEERLAQSILKSPLDGVVLAKHAEAGEMLAAGAPVVTVAKLDEVWVRAFIPEYEVGLVKLGQKAQITVDTWPGRHFDGRVSFISPQAEFTPKNVQTEKERVKLVYRIKITIPNPKQELKPGMPADALILLDQKQ